ncbi:MAG: molecular chaperone HtpG [Clostridia bacterium]|nr:molecular chaperone HtpG [Clostridia bacterium]
MQEKGGISVSTQNIFPVIKRWLYSDKDIFLREVVSNSCDAVTKLKRLVSLGECESGGEYKITVSLDKDAGTLDVSDNGIGMTADEVKRYINQIALSGALEFIDKYESKDGNSSGIIGHFGLGFYSVFMVSQKAEIVTRSYDGSPAVRWVCDENGEYEMSECERAERGTDVIMHISEDETSYLDCEKIKSILKKYCAFMPVPVFFEEDGKSEQINDTDPLWQRNPKDCTKEQYDEFYKKLTGDYEAPLMYVHINADYPLNFKGILFFPRVKNEFEPVEPKVSLYYNQVFVSESIKEVLPNYLIYVKGVLDCPELPLNVSRSYLQTNTYVNKVSQHISKKVADRFVQLFNTEREELEKNYSDLSLFLRYGCMRDEKLYDRVKDTIMFRLTDGKLVTAGEYLEGKDEGTVYYTAEKETQSYYISAYNAKGIKVVEAPRMVDTQFMQFLESKNEKVKFRRIDSGVEALGDAAENDETLASLFAEVSGKKPEDIKFASLGEDSAPAVITVSEEMRRMREMMRMYGLGESGAPDETLTVNTSSKAVARLPELDDARRKLAAKQIYMSALMLSRRFTPEETEEFVKLNTELLTLI